MMKTLTYAAVWLVVLTSVAFNLRFGWSLGDTPLDKGLWMALSLGLDGGKCTFLAYALTRPTLVQRTALRVLWLICAVYSMIGALGAAALSRDAAIAPRQGASEQRERALAGYNRASRDLQAVQASPIWIATTACTKPAAKDRAFCTKAAELQTELAATEAVLNRTTTAHADPQAESLARLLKIEATDVKAWMPILIAVVVEALSAFGFYAIAAPQRAPNTLPPTPTPPPPPSVKTASKPASDALRVVWPTNITPKIRS